MIKSKTLHTMAPPGEIGPPVRRGIQPMKCPACGSVWFRLATFRASYPQSRLKPPTLAICLCGTPLIPKLSGIRPAAEQDEVARLLGALETVRSLRQELADAEVLPDVPAGATLPGRIARLERHCQLLLERLRPESTAVTPPKPPRRGAAANGIDTIALDLQRAGLLNFREAHQVVRVVRDLWKEALAKGESIETPWGEVSASKNRSGRPRFIFVPSSDLEFEAETNRPR
jgi:hypothetical protein